MNADAYQLAALIRAEAARLGFDLVGIAPAEPSKYRDYFRQWLDDGLAGSMEYLARRFDERTDPGTYLPGARSVICVAKNYYHHLDVERRVGTAHHDPNGGQCPPYEGRIARYARGDDYHEHMKPALHALADYLRGLAPEAQTRCAVDSAPVMEKELAARAGIGWLGKNTCIINERIGSWVLLGEVLTTLELPADEPAVDRCGTCTRCIDACPTQAITAPYQLDARKCISYLTIEHRGDIAEEMKPGMGEWVFGCDICQDVCPWNKRAPQTMDEAFAPRFTSGTIDLRGVLSWSAEDYRAALKGSAMKRVKLPVLQRNARIVEMNQRGAVEHAT